MYPEIKNNCLFFTLNTTNTYSLFIQKWKGKVLTNTKRNSISFDPEKSVVAFLDAFIFPLFPLPTTLSLYPLTLTTNLSMTNN